MELSVVIPVHNEQGNVHRVMREIDASLAGQLEYEVIMVDDGSSDGTFGILTQMRADFPNLQLIHHQENCGQSAALWTGVSSARAPWIATLDGDGQNDPADILPLLRLLKDKNPAAKSPAIVGYRRNRHDSLWKRGSSRIANAIRSRLLGDQTPDTGCGLKVFARQTFLRLPYFDHMHRFLPALLQREGVQVWSVEVRHRPREQGVSHYGVGNRLWVGIVDMLGVWWLLRRNKRPITDQED